MTSEVQQKYLPEKNSGSTISSENSETETPVQSNQALKRLDRSRYKKTVPVRQQSVASSFAEDLDDNKETFCCGLCCFTGCIWFIIGSIYFFLIIPTCIILIFHGARNKNNITLGAGIGCVVLFFLIIPVLFCSIKQCRAKYKESRDSYDIAEKNADNGDQK